MKYSSRTKKRKDGLSKGVRNAVGGNSGKKGNLKKDGPTAGKMSKTSGSNNASMNMEESGKTKMKSIGSSKGDGDERMAVITIGPNRRNKQWNGKKKEEGSTGERGPSINERNGNNE